MLKTVFLVALSLGLAVGGGAASVWYALERTEEIGAVRIGPWTAYPAAGTAGADPYSKARTALSGALALGKAEGLAFAARRDSAGAPLIGRCAYRVEGAVPSARLWTIRATGQAAAGVSGAHLKEAALHSGELVTIGGGAPVLAVSRTPAPGNWLALTGTGDFSLVLTLYDTPIAGNAEIAKVAMPRIARERCDG